MVGAGRRGWEGGIDCYPALMMVVFTVTFKIKTELCATVETLCCYWVNFAPNGS